MLYSLLICQVGTRPGQSKTNFSCVTRDISGSPGHTYQLFPSITHFRFSLLHLCNMVKLLVIKTDPHIPDTAKSPCTQLSPSFMPCARQVPASRSPVTVSTKHSWEETSFIQQTGSVAPTVSRKTRCLLMTFAQDCKDDLQNSPLWYLPSPNLWTDILTCKHSAVSIAQLFVHLTQTCDMAFDSKVQALSFKFMFTFFNFGLSSPKPLFN